MYKIQRLLLLLAILDGYASFGQQLSIGAEMQSNRQVTLGRRSGGSQPKPQVRRVNRGPASEPALPDPVSNPAPTSVADQPNPFASRRRKLLIHPRS